MLPITSIILQYLWMNWLIFKNLFYTFSDDGLGITIVSNTFWKFILVIVADAAVVTQIEVSGVPILNVIKN